MAPGSPTCPRKPTLPAFILLLGILLAVPSAWAAPTNPHGNPAIDPAEPSPQALKAARQKFQKALALQTGGDWAGALTLLKEVAEVKATPQVLFNIALCEENLGQLVAALGDYELAAADARAAQIPLVETEALERLEKLRGRIPRLRVERGEGASRANITLAGVELGEAALGRDLPMDPGVYEVRAVVSDRPPFVKEVKLAEGAQLTVTITFDPIALPPSPPEPSPAPSVSTARVLGYVGGSLGLVGLAAAGTFHMLSLDAQKQLDSLCPSRNSCPEEGQPIYERGQRHTLYRNVALGVGIAGVAAGAVLWLAGGPAVKDEVTTGKGKNAHKLSAGHGPTLLGATWSGTF